MFGKNQKIGQSTFRDADDKLKITSMFLTLQGEGPFSGCPAFFVRFAHCNLACSFCDTFFDDGSWLSSEDIANLADLAIMKHFNKNVPRWAARVPMLAKKREMVLVITGGEPMLQKNIGPFCEAMLLDQFEDVQIESNGMIVQSIPDEVYLVVSPKCHEEDGKATRYAQPNPRMLERADCLKFVMSADPRSPYHTVPLWALDWKAENDKPIFVSPMNIYAREPADIRNEVVSFWEPGLLNMEENQKNHEYAARYCLREGLRLSLQTHLMASIA